MIESDKNPTPGVVLASLLAGVLALDCPGQGKATIGRISDVLPASVAKGMKPRETSARVAQGNEVYLLVNPTLIDRTRLGKRLALHDGTDRALDPSIKAMLMELRDGETACYRAVKSVARTFMERFFGDEFTPQQTLKRIVEDKRSESQRLILFCFDVGISAATPKGGGKDRISVRLTVRLWRLKVRDDPKKKPSRSIIQTQFLFGDQAKGEAALTKDIETCVKQAMIVALKNKIALSLWGNKRMQGDWMTDKQLELTAPVTGRGATRQGDAR